MDHLISKQRRQHVLANELRWFGVVTPAAKISPTIDSEEGRMQHDAVPDEDREACQQGAVRNFTRIVGPAIWFGQKEMER